MSYLETERKKYARRIRMKATPDYAEGVLHGAAAARQYDWNDAALVLRIERLEHIRHAGLPLADGCDSLDCWAEFRSALQAYESSQ